MTVYIEQVFVSNFFIDFFIVLLTVDILKCKTKKIRVFLTSGIGAAVSCLVPVIPSFVVPLKAACLIVLPFLMKKQKYAKDYFLTVSVFTAITLGSDTFFFFGNYRFVYRRRIKKEFTYGEKKQCKRKRSRYYGRKRSKLRRNRVLGQRKQNLCE